MLGTPRLLLRPVRPEDARVHRTLWTERDARVPAHRRIDAQGRPTLAEITADLSRSANAVLGAGGSPTHEALGLLTVERRREGDAIGYCGLIEEDDAEGPQIAYELLRSTQGNGYATEAAGEVVRWARRAGHDRLRATVWDWNVSSLRVLAKLGFEDTGTVTARSPHGLTLLLAMRL
ncbi:GNAT family N-acetyltransferase [Brachybacterium halotolerans subsp. kimchii]|uniref:GNAT family N-acetyltransferase n=1 Tax=Brachybacterium halotolerans TaxID=2795215 RepID=UPI001E2FFE06|nr:GNAT family N-acetyltransferase [Brachybacterium halotolerans]UEJ84187.1 GNAT family N-acetyltransferase [Brachybacterium halotolerans subsp. kimchii]